GPGGVAFSPDSHWAYVATQSGVSLINIAKHVVVGTVGAGAPVHSIVAGPSGRWVYAAAGPAGIAALDGGTAVRGGAIPVVVNGAPVNAGGGSLLNPQGLAISRDGRLLFVSDNRDGGAVAVIDVASRTTVGSYSAGPGWVPLGIALHPNGQSAYFALSDTA